MDFTVPTDYRMKIKKSKRTLGLCQKTKKTVGYAADSDTNCKWCTWNGPQRIGTAGVWRKDRDPDNSIAEIGQNTEKSPGDLRRLAVTQTPAVAGVKNNNNNNNNKVVGAFGTVTKGSLKEMDDLEFGRRVETMQMTALLRTARILRRVLKTWGDLLSLKLQWKTIS